MSYILYSNEWSLNLRFKVIIKQEFVLAHEYILWYIEITLYKEKRDLCDDVLLYKGCLCG
jgi:hypothetical protein